MLWCRTRYGSPQRLRELNPAAPSTKFAFNRLIDSNLLYSTINNYYTYTYYPLLLLGTTSVREDALNFIDSVDGRTRTTKADDSRTPQIIITKYPSDLRYLLRNNSRYSTVYKFGDSENLKFRGQENLTSKKTRVALKNAWNARD